MSDGYTSSYSMPPPGGAPGFAAAPPQQPGFGGQPGSYGQPAPTGPPGAGGNDAFGFMGGNEAVAGAALRFGGEKLEEYSKNVAGYVNPGQLRTYFKVDTAYVAKKLKLVLFPFLHSNWIRGNSSDGQMRPPRSDVNSPDLYIPAMSFVTLILVVGLALGVQDRFSPEKLGVVASGSLGWLAFEVVAYYAAAYVLSLPGMSIWELTAFASYKNVGMIVAVLGGVVTSSTLVYHVILLEAVAALAFFLLRSMTSVDGLNEALQARVRTFVIAMIGVQALYMYFSTYSLVNSAGSMAAPPSLPPPPLADEDLEM
eukprot:m.404482 g.404482  ORF g.404482 m.404482 type:complete len:312 (+) comp20126_c0_seq9:2380-3315(+)